MRETSLTRRLMLSLTAGLILFWLVALGIGVLVMRHELDEVFDSSLQETTERLLALVLDDMRVRDASDPPVDVAPAGGGRGRYLTYQVKDASGAVLLRSHNGPEESYDAPLAVGFHDTATQRIYTAANAEGTVFLQVADRFANRREAVRESAVTMLIPLALLVPLSFLGIWLIVRRVLRPVDRLRDAIASKDGGNLAPMAVGGLPRELQPILRSVNLLLERLRAALEAEREFAANSAHELRTPIAGALAQTQVLLQDLPEGEARRRAQGLEGALSALARLAEKLLQMARADSGIGAHDREIDVAGVLDFIVRDSNRARNAGGRVIYTDRASAAFQRPIDVDAFGIVMRNLIENALLHGAPGQPVTVALEDEGIIRVINDSPVVPAGELADLRKRFHRGRTRAVGSGLGLPIADRIVTQMGGRLELYSPVPGQSAGFEARIVLPAPKGS